MIIPFITGNLQAFDSIQKEIVEGKGGDFKTPQRSNAGFGFFFLLCLLGLGTIVLSSLLSIIFVGVPALEVQVTSNLLFPVQSASHLTSLSQTCRNDERGVQASLLCLTFGIPPLPRFTVGRGL